MNKFLRAGLEAVTAIVLALGLAFATFGVMFGMQKLLALAAVYYAVWTALVLVIHLVLAKRRRHFRLSIAVGASVMLMIVHIGLVAAGVINTEVALVPVIMHDFGFALISLIVLCIVHLVIFRSRIKPVDQVTGAQRGAQSAPIVSERVDDVPAPDLSIGAPAEPEAASSTGTNKVNSPQNA